jgi:formylglycine-generating enzyme required for sulfatase activity
MGLRASTRQCVNWPGAVAYCEWVGAQLPTEAQWEYAARGPENRVYPWGNDWREKVANCSEDVCKDSYDTTAPVGSFPEGASWVEALDMMGNVWEWTADWYSSYTGEQQTNPTGPESGDYLVLRGGAWRNLTRFVHTTARYRSTPLFMPENVGFRCVVAGQGQ